MIRNVAAAGKLELRTALFQATSPQGGFARSWVGLEDISLSWHSERRNVGDAGMEHFTVFLEQP